VWEQLMTGLGENSLAREVTVHASFPLKYTWNVHREVLLDEGAVVTWRGDDRGSALSGITRTAKGRYVPPPGGPRTHARIPKLDEDVPVSFDATGLSPEDRAIVEAGTGPAERLLLRLGEAPYRDRIFSPSATLAREARLPADAGEVFRFDAFEMPSAGAPASASRDIVAMVDALATGRALSKLPSAGRHRLADLVTRIRRIGGWGDAKLSPPNT